MPTPTATEVDTILQCILAARALSIPDPPGPPLKPDLNQAIQIARILADRMAFNETKPKF